MKITQTKVDEAKIRINNMRISQLYSHIHNLEEENENLRVTYFCGKRILYEEEKDYENEYKKGYILTIVMCSGKSDFKMKCEVYRNVHESNKILYNVRIDESGVNWNYPKWWNDNINEIRKHRDNIKSFKIAKELSRTWLSEVIEKYGEIGFSTTKSSEMWI